jgi:hypothetical protein
MPTARPFARNTGAVIPGTEQVGNIAYFKPLNGFAATGLPWWNGPDEDLGYVIATQVAANNQPTPVPATTASVGFWRSTAKTDASFITLAQYVAKISGTEEFFANAQAAKTWLNANGFWTSWTPSTIVSSNLILNLDAGNVSSYPGTGSTWFDLSPSGNNVNLGGTSFDPANGGSIYFNGAATGSTVSNISFTSDMTIGIWVKLTAIGGSCACPTVGVILTADNGFWNYWSISGNQQYPNYISFSTISGASFAYDGVGCLFAPAPPFTPPVPCAGRPVEFVPNMGFVVNNWYYFTVVLYNTTNVSNIPLGGGFLNGIKQYNMQVKDCENNAVLNFSAPLQLFHGDEHCGFCGGQGYAGAIHLYNRALSQSEVLQNFNAMKSRYGY